MKWGIRRYQPYGHGGYDPEHTKGRYVGKTVKAGVSAGTIGGSKNAKFGLAKNKKNAYVTRDLKERATKAFKSGEKAVKEKVEKVKQGFDKEKVEKAKQTAKKVAKTVAIASAVTLGVALAANSEPGKKFIRKALAKGAAGFDKLNKIDTGYVKEIHDVLNKDYMSNMSKYTDAMQKRRELHNKLMKKGAARITEKEKSGIYKVKQTLNTVENEFHDWYDELDSDDKKALDSLDKIIDKYAVLTDQSAKKVSEYSEKHLSAENATRTGRLTQEIRENKVKLSNMTKEFKNKVVKGDEQEMYQREIDRLAEEGRKKLAAAYEKKVTELLAEDISEDIKFIEEYLKAA